MGDIAPVDDVAATSSGAQERGVPLRFGLAARRVTFSVLASLSALPAGRLQP